MSALECKLLALYINPGDGLRLFINGLEKPFRHRCDFRSTPELALMTSCTFVWVHLYNVQFFLLNDHDVSFTLEGKKV
jgi:hypothetical protein